jgi:hypothetical protein
MHSILSISFGLVLAGLSYGLSFLPSDRLNQDIDDVALMDREGAGIGDSGKAAEGELNS